MPIEIPITDFGWDVHKNRNTTFCDFENPKYRLIINLQDMLTDFHKDSKWPNELVKLEQHFKKNNFPLEKIIVIVWPLGIKKDWPKDSFPIESSAPNMKLGVVIRMLKMY